MTWICEYIIRKPITLFINLSNYGFSRKDEEHGEFFFLISKGTRQNGAGTTACDHSVQPGL